MGKRIVNRKKRIIAASLLSIMVMGTSIPVSAAGTCWCVQSGQAAGVVSYQCNKAKYGGTKYTHTYRYGFLWGTEGTCVITPYLSNSREYCNKCDYTYEWFGSHECVVKHDGCGKGTVDVCQVMGMTPGDAQNPQNPHRNNKETQ